MHRARIFSPIRASSRLRPVYLPQPVLNAPRRYVAFGEPPEPEAGTKTPVTDVNQIPKSKSHFYFEAGYALFAKRKSRPFPPPFHSAPSSSFSDPLSTHNRSRDRRDWYEGEVIRGITNGDDAVLVSENLIAANDGVGAWAQKERGHAALWARLVLHFWSVETDRATGDTTSEPDPKVYLQRAFEHTQEATSTPSEWYGTTTASGALLHHAPNSPPDKDTPVKPLLYVTQLGDSQILVIRPRDSSVIFRTEDQWHWFDCPRQIGTNSPDTPEKDAILDKIEIEVDDVVLAMSDGVADNLWEHEVVENVVESMKKAEKDFNWKENKDGYAEGMRYVASELVKAARAIAQDPFAESPFMEKSVDEGIPTEGGKLDDISVVAALCRPRTD